MTAVELVLVLELLSVLVVHQTFITGTMRMAAIFGLITHRRRCNSPAQVFFISIPWGNSQAGGGRVTVNFDGTTENGLCLKTTRSGLNSAFLVFTDSDGNTVGSVSQNAESTVFYSSSSDYRLKENVVEIPDGINRVKQLKPIRFNFIKDPTQTVDGFLAHEAQAVVPECVIGEKDEVDDDGNAVMQGIDQSKIVPLLTAALQESIAKIETLEQRLSDAGIA